MTGLKQQIEKMKEIRFGMFGKEHHSIKPEVLTALDKTIEEIKKEKKHEMSLVRLKKHVSINFARVEAYRKVLTLIDSEGGKE